MELKVIIAVFSAIFGFKDTRELGLFTSSNVCWEPGDNHNKKSTEENDFTIEYNVGRTEDNIMKCAPVVGTTKFDDLITEYSEISTAVEYNELNKQNIMN